MVDLSISAGRAPPRLVMISRRARPIVALARQPEPNTPVAQLMSSCCRTGPLTMNNGVAVCVVPCTPCRLTCSAHIACTPATTTGRYSGLQPAITALMAIFSSVAAP